MSKDARRANRRSGAKAGFRRERGRTPAPRVRELREPGIPAVGDVYGFPQLSGYLLVQERPFVCRRGCVCGECDGWSQLVSERVADVVFWADNSVEVVGELGSRHTVVAAHGDW